MAATSSALVNLTPPASADDDEQQEAQGESKNAHYRDPTMVCGACEYFQEPNQCLKDANNGQPVEPEGGCDWFEDVTDDNGQAATPAMNNPTQGDQ